MSDAARSPVLVLGSRRNANPGDSRLAQLIF
jgi:hypothetical protein